MSAQKYRITMDMLRMAKRRLKKRSINPCEPYFERLLNAMDATDYNIQHVGKFVKELEDCYAKYDALPDDKAVRASTLHFLTQHLDREKFKKK